MSPGVKDWGVKSCSWRGAFINSKVMTLMTKLWRLLGNNRTVWHPAWRLLPAPDDIFPPKHSTENNHDAPLTLSPPSNLTQPFNNKPGTASVRVCVARQPAQPCLRVLKRAHQHTLPTLCHIATAPCCCPLIRGDPAHRFIAASQLEVCCEQEALQCRLESSPKSRPLQRRKFMVYKNMILNQVPST